MSTDKKAEVKEEKKSKVLVFLKNPTGFSNLANNAGERLNVDQVRLDPELQKRLIDQGYAKYE